MSHHCTATKWKSLYCTTLTGLLLIFFLLQTRNLPGFSWSYWSYDEGVHLLAARMLASGYQLYTDIFLVHPPVLIYSIAAAFALTETSATIGRIVAIAYATIGLVAVALTTRELRGDLSSIVAVILLGIAPRFHHYSRVIHLDIPCMSLATLAVAFSLYYLRSRKLRWLMLTGLALAASYLTKLLLLPTIFPIFLTLFLHIRIRNSIRWYSELLRDTFFLAVSIALPLALCLIVFDPQTMYDRLLKYHIVGMETVVFKNTYGIGIISNYLRSNWGFLILAIWGM